jgi:hypothetical protein
MLVLEAVQLEQAELLTCTDTPLADVAPHVLLLLPEAASLKLQAYEPTCNTLIDPPYEFAPSENLPLPDVEAMVLKEGAFLTWTITSLMFVNPDLLLLFLELLRLREYAPI